MGYMKHHAIVVTSGLSGIEEVHNKAKEIFPLVSELLDSKMNRYVSFFIPPDGSKEGWDDSDDGDERRDDFISYLNSIRYPDGSSPVEWVEVQYGDDMRATKVCRHSDEFPMKGEE